MIQLDNRTIWSANMYPGWNRQGQLQQTLVFKIAYTFDNSGTLTPLPQPAIVEADQYRGKAANSSLVAAIETVPFKKGGELYLSGSGQPGSNTPETLQVAVTLNRKDRKPWLKELRVFGKRRWQRKFLTPLPGRAQQITEPVPLIYENAFGGCDPQHPDQFWTANPAGTGYSLRGLRLQELALPMVELPSDLISSPASRVQPAGFGPLPPHWEPREKLAVTINEDGIDYGYSHPYSGEPPADLYNCAPLDQRFDTVFNGPMTITLTGLVANAPRELLLHLPEHQPLVLLEAGNRNRSLDAYCDTLIIDTDQQLVQFVYRRAVLLEESRDTDTWLILRDGAADKRAKEDKTFIPQEKGAVT